MKICILCSSTSAINNRVFSKEALTFYRLGHEVSIIASYNVKSCVKYGIHIIGLKPGADFKKRFFRNLQLFRKGLSCDSDVFYCHELDSLLIGILLKYFRGRRVVFDCHEYFPEKKQRRYAEKSALAGLIAKKVVEYLFDRFIYRFADAIVTVNKHMAKRLADRSGREIFVLPNYPLQFSSYVESNAPCILPDHTMVYIGGLNEERNITALVNILSIIRKKYKLDANLAIYGRGSEKYMLHIKETANNLGVSDNLFLSWVEGKYIPALLQQAEIGLFLLNKSDISHNWGEPIKFFEYAAAGLPVVFSDLPAKRNLVETFQNGFVVDPADEEEAASVCFRLLNDARLRKSLGDNGKRAFMEKYHWEALAGEIQRLLDFVTP